MIKHLREQKMREMKLYMIKLTLLISAICLFSYCQSRWNKISYTYPEDLSEFYYYADGATQSGIFKVKHINDSLYVHLFYDLSKKLSEVIKLEDGSIHADTFKLANGELSIKHLNDFHVLLNINSFEQKKDTFCDIRTNNYICYVPGTVYYDGFDSIYVYAPSDYSYRENFGIEFTPKKGIVAYRDGHDTLRLQKIYISQ